MRKALLFVSITAATSASILVACTGDDNTVPNPVVDSGTDTSIPKLDSGKDTNAPDSNVGDSNVADTNTLDTSTGTDAADAACNGVALTVKDSLNWCTLTVNGGASFSSGQQTVCVPAGSTVDLTATANPTFVLGPWHHTSGDTADAGDPGTDVDAGDGGVESKATVTVGDAGTACVWICCPGNGLPCPTTDQCP